MQRTYTWSISSRVVWPTMRFPESVGFTRSHSDYSVSKEDIIVLIYVDDIWSWLRKCPESTLSELYQDTTLEWQTTVRLNATWVSISSECDTTWRKGLQKKKKKTLHSTLSKTVQSFYGKEPLRETPPDLHASEDNIYLIPRPKSGFHLDQTVWIMY